MPGVADKKRFAVPEEESGKGEALIDAPRKDLGGFINDSNEVWVDVIECF